MATDLSRFVDAVAAQIVVVVVVATVTVDDMATDSQIDSARSVVAVRLSSDMCREQMINEHKLIE